MQRSKSQAVYKYLPGCWISINDKRGNSVTGIVKNWNYQKMEGIYSNFIENEIKRQIRLFGSHGGNISDFNLAENISSFSIVESACLDNIPDIRVSLSPLLYYCPKCHKMKQFKSLIDVETNFKCPYCGEDKLKQLQLVYACECGYAAPVTLPNYKDVDVYYYYPTRKQYGVYYYIGKNERFHEFGIKCASCGKKISRDSATSGSNYKAFTANVINLIKKEMGEFYEYNEDARKIIVSRWFEKISQENFNKILSNTKDAFSASTRTDILKERAQEQAEELLSLGVITKDAFDITVTSLLGNMLNDEINAEQYVAACDDLFFRKKKADPWEYSNWISNFAFNLIQYDTIKNAENIISLNEAVSQQKSMGFIEDRSEVDNMNARLGIKEAQASCDVTIVSCSYGFTRKSTDPTLSPKLKLVAFDKDRNGRNNLVFGTKLETEGLLFDIDRSKIIRWLQLNGVINEEQLPDLDDEISVKKWFANYVHGENISYFSQIGDEDKITKFVFILLHSIAHSLMKTAGDMSGISVNSLTELVFVETCSIFIYAQSSQGQVLGSLSGMFESLYFRYLNRVLQDNKDCVFDPVCTERDSSSCQGCLVLPDTTCKYFNLNLGRKYLYNLNGSDIIGFWEM